MVLLDTNILIEYYKGNAAIQTVLQRIGFAALGISVITSMELLYGARDAQELRCLKQSLDSLHHWYVTVPISQHALSLIESFAKSHTLQIPDALIAATAIEHQVPLYTLNTKDFQFIPVLTLYEQ